LGLSGFLDVDDTIMLQTGQCSESDDFPNIGVNMEILYLHFLQEVLFMKQPYYPFWN